MSKMMFQYDINDYSYPCVDCQPKVKKYKKQNYRTSRRSLKKEFEKLLVPTFGCKLTGSFPDKFKSKNSYFKSKKGPKILPDNLADFIVDNEAEQPALTEDEYTQCMDVLTSSVARKNQILQICQILGIDKEAIKRKRRSHNIRCLKKAPAKQTKRKDKSESSQNLEKAIVDIKERSLESTSKGKGVNTVISSVDISMEVKSNETLSKLSLSKLVDNPPLSSNSKPLEETPIFYFVQLVTRPLAESVAECIRNVSSQIQRHDL